MRSGRRRSHAAGGAAAQGGEGPLITVHPTATISPLAHIGLPGDHATLETDDTLPFVIGADTTIREFCVIKRALKDAWDPTRGTVIGDRCLLMTGVHVYEGCHIRDDVEINVQATLCGYVDVFDHARIGARAVIHPGVSIGAHAVVGLGAVVIEDVPPGAVVAGNPARVLDWIDGGGDAYAQVGEWEAIRRRRRMPRAMEADRMMR
jgi:acyl-[acyl carrier protein]--UDP-N-acetylglucosamine O-acyltransferase